MEKFTKEDGFEGNKESSPKHGIKQYGKKGRKPRVASERSKVDLDKIIANDISYWNKTVAFDKVTSFLWDLLIGRPKDPKDILELGSLDSQLSSDGAYSINPTQLCTVHYVPGPGYADSTANGVNRALAQLMARIRATLSTSNIGFETADLGIFFASTSSITQNIGLAKRILECRNGWKDLNYVYPRGLLRAQGFEYEDVSSGPKAPYYSSKLNSIIDRYNRLNIPDIFDVYDRQYALCHNVFRDEDSEFAQLYMFMPDVYYVYDDTASPSQAVARKYSEVVDFEDFLNVIESQIDAWYGSSDFYQINGTLLRAFKDAPLQMVPHYQDGDYINLEVDRTHLMQIMNCSIVGELDDLAVQSLTITQNPNAQNYVIWTPNFNVQHNNDYILRAESQMLRIYESDVSKEDNMEMTRLLNFGDYMDNTQSRLLLKDCGSEIVTKIEFMTYDTIADSIVDIIPIYSNLIKLDSSQLEGMILGLNQIMNLMPFRYLPTIHVLLVNSIAMKFQYLGFIGDVYNWMLYNREDFSNLQFQAYQSLWTPKNLNLG